MEALFFLVTNMIKSIRTFVTRKLCRTFAFSEVYDLYADDYCWVKLAKTNQGGTAAVRMSGVRRPGGICTVLYM